MVNSFTIAEGLQFFTDEFDFCGKTNTKQAYLRAISLFREFIASNSTIKSTENLTLTLSSPLLSLPKFIASSFSTWLTNQEFSIECFGRKQKNGRSTRHLSSPTSSKKYSLSTINLYNTAFGRVLDFWQDRELIPIYVMKYKNEKKDPLTRTLTREKDKISKNVPLDLGIVLENTSQEWVSNLPSDASRLEQLKRLRARALICVLTNSGLRVGDIVLLTKSWRYHDIDSSGSVEIVTAMSGIKTFCHFSESTLRYLDEYLEARDDISPWLFIQHGKYGTNTATNPSYYSRENSNSKGLRKRYGAPISTLTVSNIVRSIVDLAGYSKDDNITPQSIRHWLAKYLINNNVPLEKIQNALGHSSLDSLKEMYTPPSSQEQAIKCIENRNSKSKNGL